MDEQHKEQLFCYGVLMASSSGKTLTEVVYRGKVEKIKINGNHVRGVGPEWETSLTKRRTPMRSLGKLR